MSVKASTFTTLESPPQCRQSTWTEPSSLIHQATATPQTETVNMSPASLSPHPFVALSSTPQGIIYRLIRFSEIHLLGKCTVHDGGICQNNSLLHVGNSLGWLLRQPFIIVFCVAVLQQLATLLIAMVGAALF